MPAARGNTKLGNDVKSKTVARDAAGHPLCKHGKRKYCCVACGGNGICIHGRRKYDCAQCKGKGLCKHNRHKYWCKECKGKGLCKHGRKKYACRQCKGKGICKHNRHKYLCKECKGKGICKHGHRKAFCHQCKGNALCKHGKRKDARTACGGKVSRRKTAAPVISNVNARPAKVPPTLDDVLFALDAFVQPKSKAEEGALWLEQADEELATPVTSSHLGANRSVSGSSSDSNRESLKKAVSGDAGLQVLPEQDDQSVGQLRRDAYDDASEPLVDISLESKHQTQKDICGEASDSQNNLSSDAKDKQIAFLTAALRAANMALGLANKAHIPLGANDEKADDTVSE